MMENLHKFQGDNLKHLTVPCESCGKDFPWDKVTWVMGDIINKPYCDDCLEDVVTKGRR